MSERILLLGVPWYTQEEYDRCRSMFCDGDDLPGSYTQWKTEVEQFRDRCISQKLVIVEAYIDPATFPVWCIVNGCNMDAGGRETFASDIAGKLMMKLSALRNRHT